jgi:hypothetical protein
VGFKSFQKTDGGDIVAGLFMEAALANPMGAGDAEIAGGFRLWLDVEDSRSGRIWPFAATQRSR